MIRFIPNCVDECLNQRLSLSGFASLESCDWMLIIYYSTAIVPRLHQMVTDVLRGWFCSFCPSTWSRTISVLTFFSFDWWKSLLTFRLWQFSYPWEWSNEKMAKTTPVGFLGGCLKDMRLKINSCQEARTAPKFLWNFLEILELSVGSAVRHNIRAARREKIK